MALMYCRECGKQVSSEAPACPHCGVPHPVYVAPQPQPQHPQTYPHQQQPQPEYPQSEVQQLYAQQQLYMQQQPAELQPQPVYLVNPNPARRHDPTVAALLSFFLPGVGQMYKGEVGLGIAFLLGTIIGYVSCVVPGLILHIFSIINAAKRD